MGKLIRASALTLLLAYSASAGVMMTGVYNPPPPPPPQQRQSTVEVQEPTPTDPSAEIEETAIQLAVKVALDLIALL